MLGIGKPTGKIPPRYGPPTGAGVKPPDDLMKGGMFGGDDKTGPLGKPASQETAADEAKVHDLGQEQKFPQENVSYRTSDQVCSSCHHWDGAACKIVAGATDPSGSCSLFPGEYAPEEQAENESAESLGGESTPGME